MIASGQDEECLIYDIVEKPNSDFDGNREQSWGFV